MNGVKTAISVLIWQIGDAVITAALLVAFIVFALALYRMYLRRLAL